MQTYEINTATAVDLILTCSSDTYSMGRPYSCKFRKFRKFSQNQDLDDDWEFWVVMRWSYADDGRFETPVDL